MHMGKGPFQSASAPGATSDVETTTTQHGVYQMGKKTKGAMGRVQAGAPWALALAAVLLTPELALAGQWVDPSQAPAGTQQLVGAVQTGLTIVQIIGGLVIIAAIMWFGVKLASSKREQVDMDGVVNRAGGIAIFGFAAVGLPQLVSAMGALL